MNLVLDLDLTLIKSTIDKINGKLEVRCRPGLRDFLQFCFDNFQTVSIWTAGSPSYFDYINSKVLSHYLPPGRTFYKTYTSKECDIYKVIGKKDVNTNTEICIKNLHKIIGEIPYATINNTIIVDDSKIPCMLNLQNHLSIMQFEGKKSDVELSITKLKLESILSYHYVYQSLPTLENI